MQQATLILYKEIEKFKQEALEEAKKEDESYDWQTYNDCVFDLESYDFDKSDGVFWINGLIKYKREDVAYISTAVQVDMDLALEIINFYMKKLGKLKTVLEATKDV